MDTVTYSMQPLACDPAKLSGLSERLILSHYENNCGGAVKCLNAITAQLNSTDPQTAPTFLLNGLKREELIAANSMSLHDRLAKGRASPRARAECAMKSGQGRTPCVESQRRGSRQRGLQ